MPDDDRATNRQHAYTGPPVAHLPEPTYAERVRTLLSLSSTGMLSTMSRRNPGFPFGSLMPFALDGEGRPVFLISSMAMHTQNLRTDARASLFVAEPAVAGDALGSARVTVVGSAEPVTGPEVQAARELYLAAHGNSRYWVDFPDFSFFRLQPVEVYFVGGFGVMGWVTAPEYQQASADPLAGSAARIIAHMNEDHVDSMTLLLRKHAGLEANQVAMTSVDRLGFHVRAATAAGVTSARINFPVEVRTPEDTRKILVEMVRTARAEA